MTSVLCGDAERLRQSLEAGFDDHLTKPVTPRRLLDLLNRVRIAVATSRRLIEISDDHVRRTIEPDIMNKPDKLDKKPGYDLSELP